ncbi:MAG: hypothetical protein JXA55_05430 [Bacteroidales bacterium]|nr:hypothetical protein [Bacteroidales bacterium]
MKKPVRKLVMLCLIYSSAMTFAFAQDVAVLKIWDKAPHNAFTDLIRYRNWFYCSFREAPGHVPRDEAGNGKIRILRSRDGIVWESAALLSSGKYDLRDPKLSVAPGKKLMVTMGGSYYVNGKIIDLMPHVAFSDDGEKFSGPFPAIVDEQVRTPNDWIWRVTWKGDKGYGVVYQPRSEGNTIRLRLLQTDDGISYSLVTDLSPDSLPNESTIRFDKNDNMLILVRREGGAGGLLGESEPPYTDWKWTKLGYRLGGPNFLILKNSLLCIGTRLYAPGGNRTVVNVTTRNGKILKQVELPSGNDTSYPGMLIHRKMLWITYYSGHEGKTSVYLAKIRMKDL